MYIADGAVVKCSKGAAPCNLKVIDNKVYIKNKPMATIDDCTPANISSFGVCKRHDSPSCTFKPTGKWKNGKDDVVINGTSCLLKSSKLKCAFGGTITIADPGQQLLSE